MELPLQHTVKGIFASSTAYAFRCREVNNDNSEWKVIYLSEKIPTPNPAIILEPCDQYGNPARINWSC